ncbi:proton channel OTOP1 [Pristis pectinata]|uniref:proton channel OTOP1 n=1 Tax=Pristis pectinata TaxID=685728 RepID=UPI00223D7D97|nr:proton channel OTOP1 [Pristis pectinata]XP_051901029.1 proton channel OTOP1 [Pristis pectinata]
MDDGCSLDVYNCSKPCSDKCGAPEEQDRSTSDLPDKYLKSAVTPSAQYGINVFALGLVLTVAEASQKAGVTQEHTLAYLSTLMAMQLAWMLWYFIRRHEKGGPTIDKDDHAGPGWLRGGLTLFAILSLVLDMLKIGYYIGYSSCLTDANGAFPVVHAVHTISQVYFLWFHAKDVIQTFQIIERFGMIHAVFTNLLLWVNGTVAESKHQLDDHKKRLATFGVVNISVEKTAPECNCTTNACAVFYRGFYYMYPFSIEYHIFASAMLYVMWKNVGRKIEEHRPRKLIFKRQYKILPGPVLGAIVLAATIGILIVYNIQVGHSEAQRKSAVTMFYLYSITVLSLMSAATTSGLVIYRIDKRSVDNSPNPTRKLDGSLLVSTACASWLLSWCSVIAGIAAETRPDHTWLNLPFSLLTIIEKYLQNMFIIESLHRESEKSEEQVEKTRGIFTVSASENHRERAAVGGDRGNAARGLWRPARDSDWQPVPSLPPRGSETHTWDKKSLLLKNIAAFLFLCNISFWILPAFGTRPQFDNGLEENVYGFETWILIVNLAMPFAIFYRMHASASLFEVFCLT